MRYADDMLAAIQQEIRLRQQDAKKPLKTIYFGGGTPSVLTPKSPLKPTPMIWPQRI